MKKRGKRFLSTLLALCMALAMIPGTAFAQGQAGTDDLTYQLQEDGAVVITDCKNTASGALTIPSTVEGHPVTKIGDNAFWDCTGLTSVTIPDSVTAIGEYAFASCSSLTSVTIPDSVTSIGAHAFERCTALTSVTIPGSVATIADSTFYGCTGLTSVALSNGVTAIGAHAFEYCSSLTSVALPDGVSTIGRGAFEYCSSLSSIALPSSVTTLGGYSFAYSGLTSIAIPNSVTTIGEYAFSRSSLTNVTIPNSVTTLEGGAFYRCENLVSVTLPDSITTLRGHMFAYSGLTSVIIPDSITTIQDTAFYECGKLTDVYYAGGVLDWGNISIEAYNGSLTNATIHYNSTGPAFSFSDDTGTGAWTWASKHIYACYNSNVISGISNGDGTYRFEPDSSLTRAQAAVLFCQAMGLDGVATPDQKFTDDTETGTWSWAAKYIYACKQAKVISGYEDGTFQPDKTITRAEFSVMMAGALGLSKDVSVTSFPDDTGTGSWKWAGPSIYACKAAGIVSGDGQTGQFNPDNTITRAQAAVMMAQGFDLV